MFHRIDEFMQMWIYTYMHYSQTIVVELLVVVLLKFITVSEEEKIDILINNAGVICHPHEKTIDGNEYHFQVNYLGNQINFTINYKWNVFSYYFRVSVVDHRWNH